LVIKICKTFSVLLLLFSLTFPSFAHPGRTDGSGGHWNRSTGVYHYHHGYPEHQHTNGVCPYDFVDKTGQNSGTSGSSTKPKQPTVEKEEPVSSESIQKEVEPTLVDRILKIIALVIAFLFFILPMCIGILLFVGGIFVSILMWLKERFHIETKKEREQRILKEMQADIKRIVQEERQKKLRTDVLICLQQLLLREETEKAHYMAIYEGKSTAECSGMPPDVEIGPDSLPKERKSKNWGRKYTFYITPNGKAFHCRYGCSSARHRIHAYSLQTSSYAPCKRCKPELPDLSWYSEYNKIQSIKARYNIPDYVAPQSDFGSLLDMWLASAKQKRIDNPDSVPPQHSDPPDFDSLFNAWIASQKEK